MPRRVTIEADGTTRADGRPFFLIGARHMPVGGSPALLRDAGFNAYRVTVFGHESQAAEPLPAPGSEGIVFWAYLFDRTVLGRDPAYAGQLRERVGALRGHPDLLCYENFNEPTLHYRAERPKATAAEMAEGSALLRALDPDHPIWLAHGCGNTVETLRGYSTCADVVGCNPYPVQPAALRRHIGVRADGTLHDCPDRSVHAVGRYTDKMRAVAGGGPVWMLIQALANEHWFDPRHTPELAGQGVDASLVQYPDRAQLRFMVWDAIVSGAGGVALSMHRTPVTAPVWADIRHVVAELRDLHDVLATPALPDSVDVSYADLGFSIWDGVRTALRRFGDHLYLFAVNTAFDPTRPVFRLPGPVRGAVLVLGEDREVVVEGDGFTDDFAPYGVHLYRWAAHT